MSKVANVRLANKVIWALDEINEEALKALDLWTIALDRAELKCDDPALLLALARIRDALSNIRILAVAARGGEYAGRKFIVYEAEEERE